MKLAQYLVGLTAAALAAAAQAALLEEGFNDVSTLAGSGWVQTNNSAPAGSTGWFQGNAGVFASQAGASESYIAANYLNTDANGGVIDNWLISPTLSLGGSAVLTFYTRTADPGFADTLEVRFSPGSSSDVSGFTMSLLTVGDVATPYPSSDWSSFSVALPSVSSGRFAFRYTVPDSFGADYIGIDTVSVMAVPEPSTYALMAFGLAGLALGRRRQRAA